MRDRGVNPKAPWAAAAALFLLTPWAAAAEAGAPPAVLSFDFAGNGTAQDLAGFGVFAASVEVTLWAASGIAAGPLQLAAGQGGHYNWSFAQVSETGLSNLTVRSWLPWDANVSTQRVFDISNGTPTKSYPGVVLTLPFNASELVVANRPPANVTLPRGRSVSLTVELRNAGNVSVAYDGLQLTPDSPNVTATETGATPGLAERRPGEVFAHTLTFFAPAAAGPQNASVSATLASLSGANFTFAVVVRITYNRDVAIESVTAVPDPPLEGRPALIVVSAANRGLDTAPNVDIQLRLFNATSPSIYTNSTRMDLAAGAVENLSFEWVPVWSQDPISAYAVASVALDYNGSNDSAIDALVVQSTNEAPRVNFSTPADGARVAESVPVAGTSIDPEGDPFTTAFAVDGGAPFLTVNATSFAFVWDVSALPDGPHALCARATDARGNVAQSQVTVTVLNRGPNAAPSVTVDNPIEGDVVGAATRFSGKAADERGELTAVFVSLDGGGEGPVNGTSTWTFDWNATGFGEGPHLVRVRAWDGIDFSSAVFVNVTLNLTTPISLRVQNLSVDPTTALPGQAVALTGRVVYATGAGTPSAALTATVRGFPALFETVADERGVFKVNVTAPPAAGNFAVEAIAIHGNLSGGSSTSLRVSTATLPDIELLPSDFSLSPNPPVPNEAAHHTLNVRNIGAASANVTLRVYENGSLVFEWTGHVQSSRQASFDRAYAPGWHNLTLRAEEVAPQDANLSNNEVVVSIEVPGLPDFAVESLTPSLTAPRPGENITFLVLVSNVGVASGTAALEVWDGVPLAANATLVKQEFISLAPGDRWRSLAVWTPTPGNHTIFAKVVLSQPLEANLLNNELNVSLVVPQRPTPPPPSLLPGFVGPASAAALVAGALTNRRHRGRGPPRPQRRALAVAVALLVGAGLTAAWIPGPTGASLDDAGRVPGPLEGVCQTCHMDANGGGPLNPFGADYWSQRNATEGPFDWTRLGARDSDGDGYPNAQEWNDSYLPGDPDSNPATGRKYQGFAPGGVSGLFAALLALLFLTVVGVWLGFSMFRRRAARHAAPRPGKAGEPSVETGERPPRAPKP